MAWPTMHFAAGMAGAGAAATVACLMTRRGWRYVPVAMTLGGIWALIPDMPRIFREDFPTAPFAAALGDKSLERSLHEWGNLFFGHQALDAQPKEYALAGFTLIVLMYNLAIATMVGWLRLTDHKRRLARQYSGGYTTAAPQVPATTYDELEPDHPPDAPPPPRPHTAPDHDPVIYRIRPGVRSRAE